MNLKKKYFARHFLIGKLSKQNAEKIRNAATVRPTIYILTNLQKQRFKTQHYENLYRSIPKLFKFSYLKWKYLQLKARL